MLSFSEHCYSTTSTNPSKVMKTIKPQRTVEDDDDDDQLIENIDKVHQDDDFIYPALDASDDDDYIFKPKAKSQIDEAWNPKASVGPLLPKTNRPAREGVKKTSVEKGLEAAAAKRAKQLLFPEIRRPRRRRSSSKGWTNGSVWSVVCALELGLLTESSFKDVSIEKFSDGTPIAPKNAGKSIRSFSKPGADRRIRAGGRRLAEASRESFAVDRTTRSSLRQSYRRKKRSGRTNESCSGISRSENGSRRRGAPFKSKDVLGARRTSRKIRKDVAKSSMSTYDRVEIDDTVVIDNENVDEDVSESGRPVDVASRGKEDLRGECAKIMESYKFEIFKEIKSYIDRRMILNGGLNGEEDKNHRKDAFIQRSWDINGTNKKQQKCKVDREKNGLSVLLVQRTSIETTYHRNVITDDGSHGKCTRKKGINSMDDRKTAILNIVNDVTMKHCDQKGERSILRRNTSAMQMRGNSNVGDQKQFEHIVSKKKRSIHWENFMDLILEQTKEYYNARPITRGLIQDIENNYKVNFIGKLVWGFHSGWWPAIIIDAEHVGMLAETGKVWVYWVKASLISLLNEKTQVEPFCNNLETRLTISRKSNPVAKTRAINFTLQMIQEKLNATMTKPYHIWIKQNFFKSDGCEICFYPYPPNIQKDLDHLKKQNFKIIEKCQESSNKQVENRIKKSRKLDRENIVETSNAMNAEYLSPKEKKPGIIAWAKTSERDWWPAMIINFRDCDEHRPKSNYRWIIWYGDYKFSQIHHLEFLKFDVGMRKLHSYIQSSKNRYYLLGILHASKDYCSRLGCSTDEWTITDALNYFSKNCFHKDVRNSEVITTPAKKYEKYSALIIEKLIQKNLNSSVNDARKNAIMNSDAVRFIIAGKSTVNELCLRCLKILENDEAEQHPFFNGSLCKNCLEFFISYIFLYDKDGKCLFCTVCANTGIVVACDTENCPRVYCTACLKYLICPEEYDNILVNNSWKCILCKKSSILSSGIILPRLGWKERLPYVFRTSFNRNEKEIDHDFTKKKIRVLSLFDGISAGLFVLLKLGIAIDVYYSTEIDKDAILISTTHFGNQITRLGDVRNISKEKIEEIAPIDLLIGGHSLNDLSICNPSRLGLHDPNGTGVLFFEYCRIKKLLEETNKNRHLFWLYENIVCMSKEYRLEINKHLEQEPDVIDATGFSSQRGLRLYWHNFPINADSLSFEEHRNVQDIFTSQYVKYASVEKGELVLKQILLRDENDSLWITELEEILGFPRHYTDVNNLNAIKRRKLIRKSLNVATLTAILRSLCPFYEGNL